MTGNGLPSILKCQKKNFFEISHHQSCDSYELELLQMYFQMFFFSIQ